MDWRLIKYGILLVLFGVISILTVKRVVSSTACGIHCEPKANKRSFNHPFVMALLRYLGEFLSLFVYIIGRVIRRRISTPESDDVEALLPARQWFSMLPPALASAAALVTVTIAFNITSEPIADITRGSSVIFTGVLTALILTQSVLLHHWIGIFVVAAGLAIMGSAELIFEDTSTHSHNPDAQSLTAAGLLMMVGHVMASAQSVLEQYYIRKYNIAPLLALALKGMHASLVVGFLLIPTYYIKLKTVLIQDPDGRMEDVYDALAMIRQNSYLRIYIIGMIVFDSLYYYVGFLIVKNYSALTRTILNCYHIVITWIIYVIAGRTSLSLGPALIKTLGALMVAFIGPLIYFKIIYPELLRHCRSPTATEPLLREPIQQQEECNEGFYDHEDLEPLTDSIEEQFTYGIDLNSQMHSNERTRLLQ